MNISTVYKEIQMKYEIDYIEKIAKIVTDNSLSEITLGQGDDIITIRKEYTVAAPVQIPTQAPVNTNLTTVDDFDDEIVAEPIKETKGKVITSPMVGAFYAAPAPGAKPFVKVGDTVSVGQVVCIVEAMKLMNEIESEVSGRITQICVEDGQSVEYGQILMYIE